MEIGVKEVLVTLGKNGAFGSSANGKKHYPAMQWAKEKKTIVGATTGADDSFLAGVIYGYVCGYKKQKRIIAGICNAALSIKKWEAVNSNINAQKLQETCKKYKYKTRYTR